MNELDEKQLIRWERIAAVIFIVSLFLSRIGG